MYVLAGTELKLSIPYLVAGEPRVPDADTSVYLTIRDHDGSVLTDYDRIEVDTSEDPTTTAHSELIPDTVNAISGSLEKRSVTLEYIVDGQTHRNTKHYFLHTWQDATVTPDDVRRYFGLTSAEIADEDLAIPVAYFDAEKLYDDLAADLVDATKMVDANRLVMLCAASKVLPTLQLRVKWSEQSDNNRYQRLQNLDFSKIENEVRQEIGALVQQLSGAEEVLPTLVTFATPTDAITGA